MKNKVIGIHISLDTTSYAIVDVRGNILAVDEFNTTESATVDEFASKLCERLVDMMMAHDAFESIRSIGMSVPSGNYQTGCIENAVNLPWKGVVPLAAMLRDRLGLAVALGNKAHVRALGEHTFGSAHGMKNFVLITLGHGMGSCIFSGGKAYLGTDGFAGEVGHSCIVEGGRECGCGNKGCIEAYCNERGILWTAREVLAESDRPSLMRDQQQLTPKAISEMCEQGDELAIEVFRRTGYMLGIGMANYASVLNPEAIIFTGGVSLAGKWLLDPAQESFNQHVFHNIEGRVRFLQSSLDRRECDILGASVLAWDVKEYSLFK